MSEQKCRKVYVPVNLDVDAEGNIRPRLIRWIDGRVYRNHLRKCRLKSSGQRMRLLRKSPGLSGALIADTIQSSSLRIPEDMCRPNARSADARPSSMFWR